MEKILNVLHLEDGRRDEALVRAELERDGLNCHITNVSTREAFLAELERVSFDVILSDYGLPSFDGLAALAIARRTVPDTPFILVSGTLGEEAAIESLRSGATDYVLKDRLTRLGPAVRRALGEAEERARRRAAEQLLHESEERYRRLVETSPDAIFVQRQERFVYINPAATALFGAARAEELLGRPILERVHPEHHDSMRAMLDRSKHGAPSTPLQQTFLRLDGSTVAVEVAAALLPIHGEDDLQVIARDVTDRKRLEEHLRQAQKMEAIGQLAGGVAHDFNNLLTAILGYGQLARHRLGADDPTRRDIEEIEKAAARAATLTRQLLAFSRKQVLQPKVLDVNMILADTEKMLRRLIGEDVELVTLLGGDLKRTTADPGQIEQVILNLAVNARDAMPKGGSLILETANVVLAEAYTRARGDLLPGPYVLLAVSDTGCGMDAMTKARIFEPFFTTKEPGKGTGLGLSTVHGIVKQSGGHVDVYTEVGRGTTFKIYLPAVDKEANTTTTIAWPTAFCRGSETVLLVEDELPVRTVVSETLRLNGYTVIEAINGREALERCERGDMHVDLLLTDVVMPKMSGADLAARLRKLRPALSVLYVSGYTDLAVVHQGVLAAEMAFLQKPFTPEALLRKVRDVLDEGLRRAA